MGALQMLGIGSFLLVSGAVRLAGRDNGNNLAVTDGLLLDLRGNKGTSPTTWENQVPGQPDAIIGSGVTYDSHEEAFRFTLGCNGIQVPMRTNPASLPSVTYSAWVKTLGFTDEAPIVIIGQMPYVTGVRMLVLRDKGPDGSWGLGPYASCQHYQHSPYRSEAPPVAGDVWHHVGAVYDNTTAFVYVNGVQYTYPQDCYGHDPADDSHIGIGGKGDGGWSADMWITNVAVYNKALTPSEMAAMHTAGRHHGSAHATGDPHCQNVRGEQFDVFATGNFTMLQIPRRGITPGGDLLVKANIVPINNEACAPTIIDQVYIRGAWLKGLPPLSLAPGPGGIPALPTAWLQGGELQTHIKYATNGHAFLRIPLGGRLVLVVKQNTGARTGIDYLDLSVQGLDSTQEEIGGLLGVDSHDVESTQVPGCDRRVAVNLNRYDFPQELVNGRLLSRALVDKSMGGV